MKVTIEPGRASGRMRAPASKSMAHRNLICGALSGNSRIEGLEYSEDIKATLRCLKTVGSSVKIEGNTAVFDGFDFLDTDEILDCGESGSTLRFMIPLCLVSGSSYTLKGAGRLMQRPLSVYENICIDQGLLFQKTEDTVTVKGPIRSGTFTVPGNISSQFISGLLFALPLLNGNSRIEITGKLESNSYIELTLQMLRVFGIRVERPDMMTLVVPGNQKYVGREMSVEGDYSNAAFFEAFNVIGGNVEVTGLDDASLQGDRVYRDMLPALRDGCPVLDLSDCPDLAPILFTVAALNNGALFTGTARLKIKESDRAEVMKEELSKFGAVVEVNENDVRITKTVLARPNVELDGHNDHRIVMALSVLCTVVGGTINGAQAVSKSLPDFFERLAEIGINLSKEQD